MGAVAGLLTRESIVQAMSDALEGSASSSPALEGLINDASSDSNQKAMQSSASKDA